MSRPIRLLIVAVLVGLLGCTGWWLFGRSPQAQILAAQAKFLKHVEKRDWKKVQAMLTDDYADEYGLDRNTVIEAARQLLGGFFTLELKTELTKIQAVKDLGMVKMKIRVEGNGAGLSQMVMTRANQVQEPWFFHWHKKGRWPWDWKIVQIHNDAVP